MGRQQPVRRLGVLQQAPRSSMRYRRRTVWRRRVAALAVLAIAAAAVVAAVLLVVRSLSTNTHGAHVVRFTINSPLVHQSLPVAAVVPAGASAGPRPLLIFLHAKGQDQNSNLDDAFYAALARLGPRAPDVVFPYGGADSYWHTAQGALGLVRDRGGDRGRGQAAGRRPESRSRSAGSRWAASARSTSLGSARARFCAVGGHSPAMWVERRPRPPPARSTMPGTSLAEQRDRDRPARRSVPGDGGVGRRRDRRIRSAPPTPRSSTHCATTGSGSTFTCGPEDTTRRTGTATGATTSASTRARSPRATIDGVGARINHVSVNARDLQESVDFYVDLLGAEPIPTPNFGLPVQWLALGRTQLHLFERDLQPTSHHHLGITVDDLEPVYRAAERRDAFDRDAFRNHLVELPGRRRAALRPRPRRQPRRDRPLRRGRAFRTTCALSSEGLWEFNPQTEEQMQGRLFVPD